MHYFKENPSGVQPWLHSALTVAFRHFPTRPVGTDVMTKVEDGTSDTSGGLVPGYPGNCASRESKGRRAVVVNRRGIHSPRARRPGGEGRKPGSRVNHSDATITGYCGCGAILRRS